MPFFCQSVLRRRISLSVVFISFFSAIFLLDILSHFWYIIICYGGIAQLGERLNGIQEVSGSIPLISTI